MSRGVELPYTVFGRRIRPFSFSLMMATLAIGIQFQFHAAAPGEELHEHIMFGLSMLGVGLLFAGWVTMRDWVHDYGLLVVSGVWMGRTALYMMQDDWEQIGLYLSACWAISAVGAWMIERYDHKWQHVVAARANERRSGEERRAG